MKTYTLSKQDIATVKSLIWSGINFTREDYETKREEIQNELVDFDDFLQNVAETVIENSSDEKMIEDGVFIAEDAFSKL